MSFNEKLQMLRKKNNLSQEGYCWIFNNAKIYENAIVAGDVQIYHNAQVYGNAWIYDDAFICDNARIYGFAKIFNKKWDQNWSFYIKLDKLRKGE